MLRQGLLLLLLGAERSKLRWFSYQFRNPPGHLSFEEFQANPLGQRPMNVLRTCSRDYVLYLAWVGRFLGHPFVAERHC